MRPDESFVGQPVRSLQTMLRVLAKDDPRLPVVVPDGIYGPSTMNAVSAFQRQNGLPITGVTDQVTWDKVVSAYETALIRVEKAEYIEIILDPGQVLQAGDASPYIYLLQSMLTQLSQDHPQIIAPGHSGIMDGDTIDSLAGFQGLAGLPVTGEADKTTWKHLSKHFTLNAHHHAAKDTARNNDSQNYYR